MHQGFYKNYAAFNSCRIDRIYELNAHERHHKDIITSGILKIFFKPWVSELGASVTKRVACNGRSQRL